MLAILFGVVAIQVLDGISAAIIGIMFPLVVADITRETGRFSLGLGIVGSAVGIGAASSTILAGYLFDHFGRGPTLLQRWPVSRRSAQSLCWC